ncbi:MAG: hypothetical protein V4450_00770 [Bacteroidota bacterium]
MKSILHPLAQLVYQAITPSQLIQETEASVQARQVATNLAANLQINCMKQYWSASKRKMQTAGIHASQACAVHLADKIQDYISEVNQMVLKPSEKKDCVAFYQNIAEHLLNLLLFLETHFQQQFNSSQNLPRVHHEAVRRFLLQSLAQLKTKPIDQPLLDLLIESVQKILDKNRFTYGRHTYWKTLFEHLLEQEPLTHTNLLQTLVLHNFNDGRFIHYVMENCYREITDNDCLSMAVWSKWFQQINCLHPISSLALFANAPSCKELLLTAIKAEYHLQKQQAARQGISAQSAGGAKLYETTLSVAQLGVFLRLQVDAKIVQTNNISAFIRQVAEQCSTTRTPHISPENLYKKFYTCDPASVSIMRTHLANMLNCLRNFE